MAIVIVPTDDTLSYYQEEIDLDAVTFRLVFKYNSRDQAWYMDVLDASGNMLRAGIRLVDSWPLLRTWTTTGRPGGELYCLPSGASVNRPPALYELGDIFDFVYAEAGTITGASAWA